MKQAQFKFGMVLIGLALLHQEEMNAQKSINNDEENESPPSDDHLNIEQRVEQVTKAIAPVLLPIIQSLGELDSEAISGGPSTGKTS